MDLIYYIDLILSCLGRYSYLLNKAADIIYGIVRCGIQFMDIKRISVLKGHAGITYTASLRFKAQILTIYCFREDPGACCLPHTTRPAEKKGLGQLIIFDGIFQRPGYML